MTSISHEVIITDSNYSPNRALVFTSFGLRFFLPFNPPRLGSQLVFALPFDTAIALGGVDHLDRSCLIPERERKNTRYEMNYSSNEFRYKNMKVGKTETQYTFAPYPKLYVKQMRIKTAHATHATWKQACTMFNRLLVFCCVAESQACSVLLVITLAAGFLRWVWKVP